MPPPDGTSTVKLNSLAGKWVNAATTVCAPLVTVKFSGLLVPLAALSHCEK